MDVCLRRNYGFGLLWEHPVACVVRVANQFGIGFWTRKVLWWNMLALSFEVLIKNHNAGIKRSLLTSYKPHMAVVADV
ncbi:unnamed protein product [Camellia sinensis]